MFIYFLFKETYLYPHISDKTAWLYPKLTSFINLYWYYKRKNDVYPKKLQLADKRDKISWLSESGILHEFIGSLYFMRFQNNSYLSQSARMRGAFVCFKADRQTHESPKKHNIYDMTWPWHKELTISFHNTLPVSHSCLRFRSGLFIRRIIGGQNSLSCFGQPQDCLCLSQLIKHLFLFSCLILILAQSKPNNGVYGRFCKS